MRSKEFARVLAVSSILYGCANGQKPDEQSRLCEPPRVEHVKKEPGLVMFLPGALVNSKGMGLMDSFLTGIYGKDKVLVDNSSLSPEGPGRDRFKKRADLIRSKVDKGIPVEIFAHSAGAAELDQIFKIIEGETPGYLENSDKAKYLKVVLIAPSAFKGTIGAFEYLYRVGKMTYEEIIAGSSILGGVNSLNLFPPKNIETPALFNGLRDSLPELSHRDKDIPELPYIPSAEHYDKLPEKIKTQVKEIDEYLSIAFENRNSDRVKILLKKRVEILKPEMEKVLSGSGEYYNGPLPKNDEYGWPTDAKIGMARTITGEIFNNKIVQWIYRLRPGGAKIVVVTAEYDGTSKPRDAEENFCKSDVRFLPGSPHVTAGRPKVVYTILENAN